MLSGNRNINYRKLNEEGFPGCTRTGASLDQTKQPVLTINYRKTFEVLMNKKLQ
jgi:hypothetical protein